MRLKCEVNEMEVVKVCGSAEVFVSRLDFKSRVHRKFGKGDRQRIGLAAASGRTDKIRWPIEIN